LEDPENFTFCIFCTPLFAFIVLVAHNKYLFFITECAPVIKNAPKLGAAIRHMIDWRLWWSRSVLVTLAVLAGLTVVGFTWISELAFSLFSDMHSTWWWSPLLWTPLVTALVVWLTRRYAAGAAGSGIPQVIAALDNEVGPEQRGLFVSLRLTLAKIGLTSAGLLGGLSIGREGPAVQIAAGVMLQAQRFLPGHARSNAHSLLVAGGAAGIAAAFNTPLAGVMFAIEELSRAPEKRSSGLIMACIVLAGLIAVSIHGNETYFGVIRTPQIGMWLLWPAMLVTLTCGIVGGLFSRLLIVSFSGDGADRASRLRARYPVRFAALCGFLVAVIGLICGGATFGSGYEPTRAMVEGVDNLPQGYSMFKLIATWLSAWAGVPAGIFAPAVAIGASLGNDIAVLAGMPHTPALIALGMVGFLAAATQAPLTAFIIVMEMVDGHAMVLSLMACALISSGLSRTISQPLYSTLARLQLRRLEAAEPLANKTPDVSGDSAK
jgi:H+/Cl- antiporter ClcA